MADSFKPSLPATIASRLPGECGLGLAVPGPLLGIHIGASPRFREGRAFGLCNTWEASQTWKIQEPPKEQVAMECPLGVGAMGKSQKLGSSFVDGLLLLFRALLFPF